MAIPRDPTHAEIAQFLSTRSGGQMVQIVRGIREPAAQAELTASLLLTPPPVAGPSTTSDKAKKALNAFVGFRCYYISIPIFKPWPMKTLSHLMGLLWEADPNKSLWSLMAKAWSIIRDQVSKDKAPLDQFFHIICPYLNMPSPETYLERHGWSLTINKEGGPTLSQEATLESALAGAGVVDMALSVEDIINYCQSMGYAMGYAQVVVPNNTTFIGARVTARNQRRAKRQSMRDTGIAPSLREVVNAHCVGDADFAACVLGGEPNPFYDHIAGLLMDHTTNYHDDSPNLPSDTATAPMSDSNVPVLTDQNAFRVGADEGATLPPFNSTSLGST